MELWSLRSTYRKTLAYFIASLVLLLTYYGLYIWKEFKYSKVSTEYAFTVANGDNIAKIARKLVKDKIIRNYKPMVIFAKLYFLEKKICVGEYSIKPGATAYSILQDLAQGNVTRYAFTIIEGSTFKDILKNLNANPKIVRTLTELSPEQIQEKLNIVNYRHVEGLFLPDTYYFTANTLDVDLLLRAKHAMEQKLNVLWENRDKSIILKSPYEALILASIIQKESHIPDEYKEISAVYHRRLEKNIRLQADPTVIYGMQDKYLGKLYLKDLKHESDFNTYRKSGLPPTPIAMPCIYAIEAALHPTDSNALYFVAIGDGKHKFSHTLADHNKAVAEYRKRKNSNNDE
jgi:UPF0755 protein